MKSSVTCHDVPWTTHTIKRCRAWNVIIALGQHTVLEDVGHVML